jgi:hypothetical protein
MPTILRVKGYRFIIFTNDHPPAYVHVKQAEGGAKINLEPIGIVEYWELNQRQLREIKEIVEEYQTYLLDKWQEFQAGDTE